MEAAAPAACWRRFIYRKKTSLRGEREVKAVVLFFSKKRQRPGSDWKKKLVIYLFFNQRALTMTITLSYTVGLAAIYAIRKFFILRTLQRI